MECLLKTLSVIASIYPPSQNPDLSKQEILVEEINSLIITLITSAIHTPGLHNIQVSKKKNYHYNVIISLPIIKVTIFLIFQVKLKYILIKKLFFRFLMILYISVVIYKKQKFKHQKKVIGLI